MKFTVSSTKLLQQMQALSRVITSKPSLQILETILLDLNQNMLTLTASDGETTIRTNFGVDGEGEGKVAIDAKRLLDTLKEFHEQPLTFEINEQNFGINITSDNGKYSFVGVNGNEYPQMQLQLESSHTFNIPAHVLITALNKTAFCTADDDLRPVMNGIFFELSPENIILVATDAHRLVKYTNFSVHSEESANFILPKKPANLLRTVLAKEQEDVVVTFTDKNIRFEFGTTVIICRQIEGRFPNYNAVIPKNNNNKIIVDRQTILNAAKRVSVFSNLGTGLIKLALHENSINISAQDIDFSTSADETIECSYENTPMNIGFKAPFLIEIIAAVQSDMVSIELSDPSKAGLILPFENEENEEIVMLLMPMLLND